MTDKDKGIVGSKKTAGEGGEQRKKILFLLLLPSFVFLGALSFVFLIPKISPGFSRPSGVASSSAPRATGPAEDFSIGVKLSGDQKYSEAVAYFQKAVQKDPGNMNYLSELAAAYYTVKDYDEALAAYDRLIEIDGGNESVYDNRIANIHWIRKEYDPAETFFRQSIERDGKDALSYNNLALMLAEEGRPGEAIEVLGKGIRNSDDPQGLKATLAIIKGQK